MPAAEAMEIQGAHRRHHQEEEAQQALGITQDGMMEAHGRRKDRTKI